MNMLKVLRWLLLYGAVTVYVVFLLIVTTGIVTYHKNGTPQIIAHDSQGNVSVAGTDVANESRIRTSQDDQLRSPVLLLTYLRGGSTFLADVIQRSPDIFYMYEPLKPFLRRAYVTNKGVCSLYGNCRTPTTRMEDPHQVMTYTENFYNCQFQKLPVAARSVLTNTASMDARSYKICMSSGSKYAKKCLDNLREQCQKSIRSLKFIRLSFSFVEMLMERLPNLKVIHLLRDPRGIISSRFQNGYLLSLQEQYWRTIRRNLYLSKKVLDKTKNMTNMKPMEYYVERHAMQLCSQINNDITINLRLSKLKPGRIQTVVYEGLADHPIEGAKRVYDFLGITYTKLVEQYIYNITMSGKSSSGAYSTTRTNASATAHSWRKKLPTKYINIIDKHCKNVYDLIDSITQ